MKFNSKRVPDNLLRKIAPVGMVHYENDDVDIEKTDENFVH